MKMKIIKTWITLYVYFVIYIINVGCMYIPKKKSFLCIWNIIYIFFFYVNFMLTDKAYRLLRSVENLIFPNIKQSSS